MAIQLIPTQADVGISELVRRLRDDSTRLVKNEIRLAKLELHESVHDAGHGAMFLAIAFGVGVVAAVMLTLTVVTVIGRIAAGHMWLGAIVTGVVEVLAGGFLVKRGLSAAADSARSISS